MIFIIIDDSPQDQQHLSQLISEWSATVSSHYCTLTFYSSCEEYLSKRGPGGVDPDAIFLDISLDGMDGVSLAEKLRHENYKGPIIFTTAFREFVLEGYHVRALDFLLKPVSKNQLFFCLDELLKEHTSDYYYFSNKKNKYRLRFSDILYFETSLHHVKIVTEESTYEQLAALNTITEKLPDYFIRIHRAFVVNMNCINSISRSEVVLSSGKHLPVSRTFEKGLHRRFIMQSRGEASFS